MQTADVDDSIVSPCALILNSSFLSGDETAAVSVMLVMHRPSAQNVRIGSVFFRA